MEALLYPYQIRNLNIETKEDKIRTASLAATLLYFDKIILAGVGLPPEPELPTLDEVRAKQERLRARFGLQVFQAQHYGRFAAKLTCEDVVYITYGNYLKTWAKCRRQLEPLIKAGVVAEVSLLQGVKSMRAAAEQVNDARAASMLTVPHLLSGYNFFELTKEIGGAVAKSPNMTKDYQRSWVLAEGTAVAEAYLCKFMQSQHVDDSLDKRGIIEHERFRFQSYCLHVFAQSFLSQALRVPLVSDDESHYAVRAMSPLLSSLMTQENDTGADIALKTFACSVLTTLPPVLPKSFEAILEIRDFFRDDLLEFRERIQTVVRKLFHDTNEPPSQQEIQELVSDQFSEPLRAIEKQLAKPTRRLAINLLGSGPLIGGVIALMGSLLTGGSLSIPVVGAGVLIAGLIASLKTTLEEWQTIDNSKVAFLLKAKRYLEEQSKGITIL